MYFVYKNTVHLNRTVLQRHVSSEKRRLEKGNFLKYFDKKENYN